MTSPCHGFGGRSELARSAPSVLAGASALAPSPSVVGLHRHRPNTAIGSTAGRPALGGRPFAGRVLGSAVNWLLGTDRFRDRKWFPVKPAALDRAAVRYRRYGKWSLLLSWVPIIGDPLTVVAGVLREPLWSFLAIVTVAKAGRYLVLAAATLGL